MTQFDTTLDGVLKSTVDSMMDMLTGEDVAEASTMTAEDLLEAIMDDDSGFRDEVAERIKSLRDQWIKENQK